MKRLGPMGILLAVVALFSAFQFACVVVGTTVTEADAQLTSFGLALSFLVWIVTDARERHRTPCYDFGFIVAAYFPFSLIWYVFWSRGWRGFLMLAAFLGLTLIPWLSAMMAWGLRHGFA